MKSKRAYTLIELIVAVIIVSLIFSLTASFIWMTFKLSTRTKQVSIRLAGARNVLEILAAELRSAIKFDYLEEPNFYLEDGKVLSFWTTIPISWVSEGNRVRSSYQGLFKAPIYKITYFFKNEGGEKTLYKKIESPFERKVVEEYPVLKANFNFSAVFYDKAKRELKEVKDYSGIELPLLIKIKCELDEGTQLERTIFIPVAKEI
jgi:prepilin-type N-terminal cleavage/methylation domain-containing protein